MANSIAPATKEARSAIGAMTEYTRELYERVLRELAAMAKTDVMKRYDIGAELAEAMEDESKYGKKMVQQLATALQISDSLLYYFIRMTKVWPDRADMEAVLEEKNQTDGSLTFGHITAICMLNKATDRTKALKKWKVESMSVRDMDAFVKQLLGRGTASTEQKPKSPNAGVTSMTKLLVNARTAHENLQSSLFDNLNENADKYASQELIDKLTKMDNEMAATAVNFAEDRRKIASALDVCNRIVLKKEEEDQTPEHPSRRKATALPIVSEEVEEEEEVATAKPVRQKSKQKHHLAARAIKAVRTNRAAKKKRRVLTK